MAVTHYSTNNVVVENVTVLPRSAAKIAAGLLILTTVQYSPATDIARARQARFFEEPATFVLQKKPSNLVVLLGTPSTYNPATDVRRAIQAKYFEDQPTFVKTQASNPLVLATNALVPQTLYSQTSIFVDTVTVIKSQKGSLVVLSQAPVIPQSSDTFIGQDTTGWPKEAFEPESFVKTQRGWPLVTNTFTAYNPGTDVRRASQAKFFAEPETFVRTAPFNYLTNNTVAYNFRTDITRLKHQALYFAEAEVFLKSPRPFPIALNFTPYVPATDVRRAQQAKVFTEPEVFARPAPFNEVITNGLVQSTPLEFAHGIDIYDDQNGSILVAWGAFTPTPQSYNIYVTPVSTQTYELGLESGAPFVLVNGSPVSLTYSPAVPDVFYANVLGLMETITGLTISSYNPSTQVITPSTTYVIKVVAVINGKERGEISETITPSPTSVALVTPMKRLWPFPNTGLD